jgi:gas vesicle protein
MGATQSNVTLICRTNFGKLMCQFTKKFYEYKIMDSEQESKLTKGLFLGFVAGGVVGAIVALLYAPKPGRELRRDIRDRKDLIVDKAGEIFSGTAQTAEEFLNQERERTRQVVTSAKERAQTILDTAERSLSDAKTRASGVVDSVKQSAGKVQTAAKAGMDSFRDELKKG